MLGVKAGLIALVAIPASAQENCGDYAKMVEALGRVYGETRRFQGPSSSGQYMVEIFAKDGGTWTALIVNPNGFACITAAGDAWLWVPAGVDG